MACSCVFCGECGGTGNVWFSFGGKKYLGRHRSDDLDEMETCDTCEGTGITEMCDECIDAIDHDERLEGN